jgi:hypothetical protein
LLAVVELGWAFNLIFHFSGRSSSAHVSLFLPSSGFSSGISTAARAFQTPKVIASVVPPRGHFKRQK